MIVLAEKNKCIGCSNCYNICPQNCIKMEWDYSNGFLYPQIDSNKCIKCELCQKVCPIITPLKKEKKITPFVFAAQNKDFNIRMNSSSGGFFYEVANYVYSQNGYVWGAAYKNNTVQHICTSGLADIELLQRSKYVQSELSDSFIHIESQLKQNKLVLFSGTPCQITALKSFLRKNYSNLITAEVFCHGVPSPWIYQRYLKEQKATGINFRQKKNSWNNYDIEIKHTDGRITTQKATENHYMLGFIKNLFIRPSCFNCTSKYENSSADFTIGDLWGVHQIIPEFDDDKGTSAILLNTTKAIDIWKSITINFNYSKIILEDVIRHNPSLIHSAYKDKAYDVFWEKQEKTTIDSSIKEAVNINNNFKHKFKKKILAIYDLSWALFFKLKDFIFILLDKVYCISHKPPHIINIVSTLEYIRDHKCSVSRYGDGEMKFVVGGETWFQPKSPLLKTKLKEILKSNIPNHIVCIPQWFDKNAQYSTYSPKHCAYWRKRWYNNIDMNKTYYDAMISRCYIPFKNYDLSKKCFNIWQQIWNNKDLLIIEGEKTRLGVGNDLFANVKSIKRILCTNTNGFQYYSQLLSEAQKYDKDHLILLAVGPTATILAADLALLGYQAIDCGHVDIEYEWFLKKTTQRIPIHNKFVNEAGAGKFVGEINNQKYFDEIVYHFN